MNRPPAVSSSAFPVAKRVVGRSRQYSHHKLLTPDFYRRSWMHSAYISFRVGSISCLDIISRVYSETMPRYAGLETSDKCESSPQSILQGSKRRLAVNGDRIRPLLPVGQILGLIFGQIPFLVACRCQPRLFTCKHLGIPEMVIKFTIEYTQGEAGSGNPKGPKG